MLKCIDGALSETHLRLCDPKSSQIKTIHFLEQVQEPIGNSSQNTMAWPLFYGSAYLKHTHQVYQQKGVAGSRPRRS